MTHNNQEWDEMKVNIHSPFMVMLHSVLAFPKKTAGETAQKVIKVFEEYALSQLLSSERKKWEREAWVNGFLATNDECNGDYCLGRGGHDVIREEIYKIYDEYNSQPKEDI